MAAEDAGAGVLGIFESSIGPNDSSIALWASPRTPGISRTTASITTIAATSPPERMKSPTESSSGSRISMIRSSNPSYRPQNKNQSWFAGQLGDPTLIEPAPLGREHDQAPGGLGGRLHGLGRRDDRRGHQDHSRAAAERPIVDLLVLSLGPVADVPALDLDQPLLDRPAQDALAQETVEERREERQHVDAMRRRADMRGTVRPPWSRSAAGAAWLRAAGAAGAAGCRRRGGFAATCHGSPGAGFFTPNLFESTCTLCDGWAPTDSQ